jgi:hypothetical protein
LSVQGEARQRQEALWHEEASGPCSEIVKSSCPVKRITYRFNRCWMLLCFVVRLDSYILRGDSWIRSWVLVWKDGWFLKDAFSGLSKYVQNMRKVQHFAFHITLSLKVLSYPIPALACPIKVTWSPP